MEIEERYEEGVTILSLQGELVGQEAVELLREKIHALCEEGRTKIVLDLAICLYADSAGLGEIVRCYITVSRNNGELRLINLSERLHDVSSFFDDDDDDWPSGAAGVTSLGALLKIKPKT